PVTEIIARAWHEHTPELRACPNAARTYLPLTPTPLPGGERGDSSSPLAPLAGRGVGGEGRAPAVGEVFRNSHLARTYRELATSGPESFYRGRIAHEIVAFSEAAGGLFTLADFADHTSTWVDPVSTTYRGHEVWQLPPP